MTSKDVKARQADPPSSFASVSLRLRLCAGLFLLLTLETIFSVPYRSVYLAVHSVWLSWTAALGCTAFVLFLYDRRETILISIRGLASTKMALRRWWHPFWLTTGLTLRLGWALYFHTTLKSDGLAYFLAAKSLAVDHGYAGAFWPPGFSLFLTPFFLVFGAKVWVTILCALLLFVGNYWLTYLLATRIANGLASQIAPMLVAVWPTYVALTGVNSKETLLAVLVPAALIVYLKAENAAGIHSAALVSGGGVLVGLAALTQPGYLLFPGVFLGFELLQHKQPLRILLRTMIFTVGMVTAVLPWTYRNYLQFHRLVLISTNGGSVFYRANNPKANASYAAEGEEVLPKNEFEADKKGYSAGVTWIRRDPVAFAALAVRKQVVYLGDDGIGVYESMKRGLQPSPGLYGLAKLTCNSFWLACWAILLLGFPGLFRPGLRPLSFAFCFLPMLYQWFIDSIFESGSRHHVPYIALVAILVSMVLTVPLSGMRPHPSEEGRPSDRGNDALLPHPSETVPL